MSQQCQGEMYRHRVGLKLLVQTANLWETHADMYSDTLGKTVGTEGMGQLLVSIGYIRNETLYNYLLDCHSPTSTPTQLKSWVRHGNHQKPPTTPPQTQKLHERTRKERYLGNIRC